MVHHGQSLALGLKAGDDLFGVHPQLDGLEGHPAPDRLILLGYIHHAAAAFADLLEQFVGPNAVARSFVWQRGDTQGRGHGGVFKRTAGGVGAEQRLGAFA